MEKMDILEDTNTQAAKGRQSNHLYHNRTIVALQIPTGLHAVISSHKYFMAIDTHINEDSGSLK